MRRWLLALPLCALAACSDPTPAAPVDASAADATDATDTLDATDATTLDTSAPDGMTPDAAAPDATPDAGRRVACLDQPTELLRPPSGVLPCELVPPGL